MENITVRITDSKGVLVRYFRTNDGQIADEQIAMWQRLFAKYEPDEKLTVERVETDA